MEKETRFIFATVIFLDSTLRVIIYLFAILCNDDLNGLSELTYLFFSSDFQVNAHFASFS